MIESPRTRGGRSLSVGKGSGPIVESHAVDRSRSGAPPSGHVRTAAKRKKGGGGALGKKDDDNGGGVEGGKYWPRQAVSGLPIFRPLLVDPYEANYTSPRQRHPTYSRQPTFLSSALQHVLDTATVKAGPPLFHATLCKPRRSREEGGRGQVSSNYR